MAINKKIIRFSLVVTLLVCLIVGSVFVLFQPDNDQKPEIDVDTMIANEVKTLKHLQAIYNAQQRYHETDWDNDGIKSYAQFIVHLWQTVDDTVSPVETRFISKKLAFAMGRSRAIDGYYFESLRTTMRDQPNATDPVPMDVTTHWAVMATPLNYGQTGVHTYIVTQAGKVYAKNSRHRESVPVPDNYKAAGWVEVLSARDVSRLHIKRSID